jgi:hypothetical protein
MTTGSGDEKAMGTTGHGHLRASHADRDHVIDALKAAFVDGRLTKDEFDVRVGQTFASQTCAELAALTTDLPAGPVEAQPLAKPTRAQVRPPANKKAVKWSLGVCAHIPPAMLVIAVLTDDHRLAAVFAPMMFGYFFVVVMVLMVAGAKKLESRHQRRSRGELPPRPGQGGHALEGERHGGTGHDPAPLGVRSDETRADLRARRSPRDRSRPSKQGVQAARGMRPAPGAA